MYVCMVASFLQPVWLWPVVLQPVVLGPSETPWSGEGMLPVLAPPSSCTTGVELVTGRLLVELCRRGSPWPGSCSCISHVEELSRKKVVLLQMVI